MADILKKLIIILAIMLMCETPPGWTKKSESKKNEPKNKDKDKEGMSTKKTHNPYETAKYRNTYEINMWYRYAKYTALSRNHSDCYVCSKMPKSGSNPHVTPEPVLNVSSLFPECLVSAYSPQLLYMIMGDDLPPPVNASLLTFDNFQRLPFNVSVKMYGPVHFSPRTKFICYENMLPLGDETFVGKVPRQNCKVILTPCTINQTGHFNHGEARRGATCVDYFTAPDVMGTTPQTHFVWLCGMDMYHHLPTGWRGRCAPVIPTDHSFIIVAKESNHRTKRGLFQKHDSVWGTDVPNDHKLWTDGQKVALSLFPWLGTGKLILRMETVAYRFETFLNSTTAALRGIREELTALRMMELQDRMVLDQLTASLGGVCAAVGASCCTFIPANDENGEVIEQAINNLTMLRDTMEKDLVTTDDLLQWLFGGSWGEKLIKMCLPVLLVLFIIVMCFTCILPCIMTLIRRMVRSVIIFSAAPFMSSAKGDERVKGPPIPARRMIVKEDSNNEVSAV